MIKENTPLIETERLILRRFVESDIGDMLLLYGDEEVNKFLPWFTVKSTAEAEKYLHDNILTCYQKDIAYSYAVAHKFDNRAIGYVNLHDIGGSNELGYGLRKEFWHSGIITEACTAVVSRLRKASLAFITATHDVNNPYSGEVMKKLGMTYRYSYEEKWQPKGISVAFRMYQLNLDGDDNRTYMEYWNSHEKHWLEEL